MRRLGDSPEFPFGLSFGFKRRVLVFSVPAMEIFWAILAFSMLLIGAVGIFVPVIPGPLVSWSGILLYFIFTPQEALFPSVNVWTLAISGVLVAGSFIFDYWSSYWGAVKFGATWRGGVGALIGAIAFPLVLSLFMAGIPGAIVGLLVGPIVGAFVGEYLGGNTCGGSVRAGLGTLVGAIAATLLKLFVCVLLAVWFTVAACFSVFKSGEEKTQLTTERQNDSIGCSTLNLGDIYYATDLSSFETLPRA